METLLSSLIFETWCLHIGECFYASNTNINNKIYTAPKSGANLLRPVIRGAPWHRQYTVGPFLFWTRCINKSYNTVNVYLYR